MAQVRKPSSGLPARRASSAARHMARAPCVSSIHTLAIKRSGKPGLVVGAVNALTLHVNVNISASVDGQEVTLDARGLNDLGNEYRTDSQYYLWLLARLAAEWSAAV